MKFFGGASSLKFSEARGKINNMEIKKILSKIIDKKNLTVAESMELANQIMEGKLGPVQIAAILTALRMKGESVDEILGFIKVMRKKMVKIKTNGKAIDTCGTGGDESGTFNISTTAAFVAAGAGAKVAKHGNRAASSKCGSADVLEALDVNINLCPEKAEKLLKETGFTFLFAPLYHPAMKNVAPVRKELGIRTIFNFLGPFINPASVKRQIIGVPNQDLAEKLSEVAKELGYKFLMLVTSKDGLDEISILSKTYIYEVMGRKIKKGVIIPSDFGFKKSAMAYLMGKDAKGNAEIVKKILKGKKGANPHTKFGVGARRDIVLLNSAAALYVAGIAKDIKEGILLAQKAIDNGKAYDVLEKVRHFSNRL